MEAKPDPQLAVRSARAVEAARRVRKRTGKPIVRIVEEALEDYEASLSDDRPAKSGYERAMEMARAEVEAGRVTAGRGSDTSDLYDDEGMPL
jgi:hypothetical protein